MTQRIKRAGFLVVLAVLGVSAQGCIVVYPSAMPPQPRWPRTPAGVVLDTSAEAARAALHSRGGDCGLLTARPFCGAGGWRVTGTLRTQGGK